MALQNTSGLNRIKQLQGGGAPQMPVSQEPTMFGSVAQQFHRIPVNEPDQTDFAQSALQGAMQFLPNMGNLSFDPIEQHAMQQFEQQGIPSIADRFLSMGGTGALRSTPFFQALGSARANLASSLAAQRAQYGLQSGQLGLNSFNSLSNIGMQPRFATQVQPAQQSGLSSFAQGILPVLGQVAGAYAGGIPSAISSGIGAISNWWNPNNQQQQQQPLQQQGYTNSGQPFYPGAPMSQYLQPQVAQMGFNPGSGYASELNPYSRF